MAREDKWKSEEELLKRKLEKPESGRPHVVILGAGASKAAIPYGDRNGLQVPLMNDLVEVTGLSKVFDEQGITWRGKNFESLYSEMASEVAGDSLLDRIESHVRQYFEQFELPDEPTVYDYLVLSLREKDLIATFNWDPLLAQALYRNSYWASMPNVVYLHGNVAIGYCMEHDPPTLGWRGRSCKHCGSMLVDTPILFPIEKKDYSSSPILKMNWDIVKAFMQEAYFFTVFGYSAPKTDVDAVNLLKEGWGDIEERRFEETEIIDIRDADELEELWSPFIHTHHRMISSSFFSSSLWWHPRRTCEALWQATMMVEPYPAKPMPRDGSLGEIWEWVRPYFAAEVALKKSDET